jgi:hypothetical protein
MRTEVPILLLGCVLSSCSTMPVLFPEDEGGPQSSLTQKDQRFGAWYSANSANDQAASYAVRPSGAEVLAADPLPQIADAMTLGYEHKISFDAPDKNAPRLPHGCSIKERFDRTSVLAYNFSDRKSRLSLHMDIDGIGLKNPANIEVEGMMLKFRYKFQPIKDRKEACLYPSGWQGWGGSVYNEFFVREKDTIREELMDKNPLGLFD